MIVYFLVMNSRGCNKFLAPKRGILKRGGLIEDLLCLVPTFYLAKTLEQTWDSIS